LSWFIWFSFFYSIKKEIGIRKVIGASVTNIVLLLSKNFIKTVLISILIGAPIAYLVTDNWLNNFAKRIDLNIWLFLISTLVVLILVLLSISLKTISAALSNPINSLKEQ